MKKNSAYPVASARNTAHQEEAPKLSGKIAKIVTPRSVPAAKLISAQSGLCASCTAVQLAHKPLCALISFAAGTLLGVTIFAILPESFGASSWWAVFLALATGYALFFFISKHVHHVCPACAASHLDADATRYFSEIATALIVALAIHSTTDG